MEEGEEGKETGEEGRKGVEKEGGVGGGDGAGKDDSWSLGSTPLNFLNS